MDFVVVVIVVLVDREVFELNGLLSQQSKTPLGYRQNVELVIFLRREVKVNLNLFVVVQ